MGLGAISPEARQGYLMNNSNKWQQFNRDILDALHLQSEYAAVGIDITSKYPNDSGWLECRANGREDKSPSAGINVGADHPARGRYKEFVGERRNMSFFEAMAVFGGHADWKEARKYYAQKTGTKFPSGRPPKSPEDKLKFRDWNEKLAYSWATKKAGVDAAVIRPVGARLADWPTTGRITVLAFPVFGSHGADDNPTGWILYNVTGQPLPLDNEGKTAKMLLASGSERGWVGQRGLSILPEAEIVWKVEGTTDLLALESALQRDRPDLQNRHAVISNSNGSMERPDDERIAMLAGKVVYVLHDADKDGENGGERWAAEIARHAIEVRHVRLPLEIKPNHGADVRDWLNQGHTYDDLLMLAANTDLVGSGTEGSNGEAEDPVDFEKQLLASIGVEVLGEHGLGRVKVFSDFHRKTDTIPDVSKLTFHRLLQIAGPIVREKVNNGQGDVPGMAKLSEVKQAISLVAGYHRISDASEAGRGIWCGLSESGAPKDNLVLVGAGEAAVLHGTSKLERILKPRLEGRLLDISGSVPWYDYSHLRSLVQSMTQDRAKAVVDELTNLFARWRWSDSSQSPEIVTGLVLATWIQTVWHWRPQVMVIGKTMTGKSTLFSMLKSLFGDLSILSSGSSAAGIRQALQTSASVALCDEFDSNCEREKILEMLRAAGRGDEVLKGTSNHEAQRFILQHMCWIAGIESGLRREPDKNRFIALELISPEDGKAGLLTVPTEPELHDLGQRSLAVAIRYGLTAVGIAKELRQQQIAGVSSRIVESYAVPAAMYATVLNDAGTPEEVLRRMIEPARFGDSVDDEQLLLGEILGSRVRIRNNDMALAKALEVRYHDINANDVIEACGIGVIEDGERNSSGKSQHKSLFVAHNTVKRHLLKGTEWEKQSIDQVLARVPGAEKTRYRIGGKRPRGIKIPFSSIEELTEGD